MRNNMLAILMVPLLVASSNAVAEWVEFGHNAAFTGYIDSAQVSRGRKLVRLSSLIDYKTVQTNAGKAYVSAKAQHEFDCEEGQARKIFSSIHSGNMGNGEIVSYSYKIDAFEPIQSRSILETMWKIACEYR